MTMGDLLIYRAGQARRRERERETLAHALVVIVNAMPRAMAKRPKPITVEQLLGRKEAPKATSMAEIGRAQDRSRVRAIRRMERST